MAIVAAHIGVQRRGQYVGAVRTVRVIPCLDVDLGRVVKGVNFVGLRDAGDPVELAARYDAEGADELIFLDITASSDNRQTVFDVVARTAETVFIPLTVGGGVRVVADARRLLRSGADKVSSNSAAVARPQLIDEIAQSSAPNVWLSPSTPGHGPMAGPAGRCSSTAGARPPELMPFFGPRRWPDGGPARSCSRRWIVMEHAMGLTSASLGQLSPPSGFR